MKFFKYLIFAFFLLQFQIIYAAPQKVYYLDGKSYASAQLACNPYFATREQYLKETPTGNKKVYEDSNTVFRCWTWEGWSNNKYGEIKLEEPKFTCPKAGERFIQYFPTGNPVPQTKCVKGPDGNFCKYENKDSASQISNLGSKSAVYLTSVSDQPTSSCNDSFGGSCNSNDPYGGCYTPPNDGCTRGSDGSIYCPPDSPPPKIESGCTGGATYCDRPKGGCGSDYVSGSYNGKAVCVKKSNNTGNNNGSDSSATPPPGGSTATTNNADGSKTTVTSDANGNPVSTTVTGADGSQSTTTINKDGTSTTITKNPDGTSSTSTGTTTTVKNPDGSTTTTINNNNSTTVINNNNNSTTTTTTNPNTGANHSTGGQTIVQQAPTIDMSGVISAINAVAEKITWLKDELSTSINDVSSKIDKTNEKIDQSNTKLDESNQNLRDIKDVLDEIKNKPDGSNGASSPNGSETDLSGIEGKLDGISETLTAIKDWLFEENQDSEPEEAPTREFQQQELNSELYKVTGQCPVSKSFSFKGHTFTLDLSQFCYVLQVMGYIVALAACLHGIAILSENT